MFLAFVSLFVGIIGIFIPIFPTVPFIILSIYLFSKSSKKFHLWISNNKYFKKYLSDYLKKKK
ncbi:DUF454 family protein [Cetobacterium sp. 2A]|uniref:DUF454 family protein n=1 Tax=unclassified Cetobacterium TaxID=2630983 RepID=UPI00351B2B4A